MKRSVRIAPSAKRIAYLIFKLCPMRSALCAPRAKWILGCLILLVSAGGCTYFQRQLTPAELAERIQYGRDELLEELVKIALVEGNWAVNGEGRARQVLELSRLDTGSIHRQFFEVQARGAGVSSVFFLENVGSVDQTKIGRFPADLRKEIKKFLAVIPEAGRNLYKPLLVRQEKLLRQMVVYELNDEPMGFEFSEKVSALEKSELYGLFRMPAGPFVFFGKSSREPLRRDLLAADERFKDLVREFLDVYRPKSNA